jgi:hypothetical protein
VVEVVNDQARGRPERLQKARRHMSATPDGSALKGLLTSIERLGQPGADGVEGRARREDR